ncbi:UNVERIFIED_CONTAM: putative inositol transporter 3 [Sesamum radiatum]|uniref:Inositol transporter 3 n=1 Tax=Sesamum radiatum TaxID=300843 RepID=A0AAW2T338_SESRA
MYYSPTIVQLAGFASNSTALALSLITSGLNAVGSIVSMAFVDRVGRRRLMIISMFGIIICLVALATMFYEASDHSPPVSSVESLHFGRNATCTSFLRASQPSNWNCMTCLKASSECGFCANGDSKYWALYIISYSPGMGTAPWIVNSEIYPLRYRGMGGGIAAVSNWVSNLIVSETFLTLTEAVGSAGTFLLFAGFSAIGLIAIYFLVPETKGLAFEEVERMLAKGFKPRLFCMSNDDDDDDDDDDKK